MNIYKIKNKAKFVLDDSDYKKLIDSLEQNKIHTARILIDEIHDKVALQLTSCADEECEQVIKEMNLLEEIESEIFNLYVEEDEGEQIKHIIR